MLTNQQFVAGIGNAYTDEILWYTASPRASLSAEEVDRLYRCMQDPVLQSAIETLRERVGDNRHRST